MRNIMAMCRLRRHGLKYFSASPQRGDMRNIIAALRILYHNNYCSATPACVFEVVN